MGGRRRPDNRPSANGQSERMFVKGGSLSFKPSRTPPIRVLATAQTPTKCEGDKRSHGHSRTRPCLQCGRSYPQERSKPMTQKQPLPYLAWRPWTKGKTEILSTCPAGLTVCLNLSAVGANDARRKASFNGEQTLLDLAWMLQNNVQVRGFCS